jgi:uncharacterized protein YybS (DUF2232 family)
LPGNRRLVWGCALVAVVALILAGRLSAMATLFLGTWVPLPLLIVGWRQGTGPAALLAGAGTLVILAFNPGLTVFQDDLGLWLLLLLGLVLTVCRQRGWTPGAAIMFATAALGVLSLVWFVALAYFQGLSPPAFWEQKAQEIIRALMGTLEQSGMEVSDLRVMGFPRGDMQNLLVQVLPGLALLNIALVAWVNVLAIMKVAQWRGWGDPGAPLAQWTCPEWLVFCLVAAGFALLAPPAWVRVAGLNLLLIVGFAYFGQGIAVIAALLLRYQAPWGLRFLVYVLAFVNPVIIMVMILGLMDLWLDFRRLQPPREA